MSCAVRIAYLADHSDTLQVFQKRFETEWPAYYCQGGPGDAEMDLLSYSSRDKLPIGLIAFHEDQLCGIAVLKAESITTHQHLGPWAAAGLVFPPFRRKGIGARLILALEGVAKALGYSAIYCGTSTATSLLERIGWEFMERVRFDGEDMSIYQKFL